MDYEVEELAKVVAAIFMGAYIAYKTIVDKKRHKDITGNQSERNTIAVNQKIQLDRLQESIELSNGFDSKDMVAELKHIAYGDQKLYFLKELHVLFERNGLHEKEKTVQNVKTLIEKTISITDSHLSRCIPESFLAKKADKIEFINSSVVPDRIYNILVKAKTNHNCLFGELSAIYDFALGLVVKEFYDDNGRIKEEYSCDR